MLSSENDFEAPDKSMPYFYNNVEIATEIIQNSDGGMRLRLLTEV